MESFGHSQITQICLIYLLDSNGGRDVAQSYYSDFPFLGYAAHHWSMHFTQAKVEDEDTINTLLRRMVHPQNEDHQLNLIKVSDILYEAAKYGDAAVVRQLTAAGATIRTGTMYEDNALHIACRSVVEPALPQRGS